MPLNPHISYFISRHEPPLTKHSKRWQNPLPLSRNFLAKNDEIPVSHGEYFSAVRTYFENDGFEVIYRAISQHLQKNIKPEDMREIGICLEKHGEFYHPARIIAVAGHQQVCFVLNVAVSETGIQFIKEEYQYLKKLNDEFTHSFLPRVYGFGEVSTSRNHKIQMFLGEWFEGYNEFHISREPSDSKNKILIWDDADNPFFLSPQQSAELYQQAATILTYYYNIETFEQIFPWHHAAGDFVVRATDAMLDVKLITVRRYAPFLKNLTRIKNSTNDIELILQALLIFFLNLSIRMRLDRLDGVGDVVWADKLAVHSTLAGFIKGLGLKPPVQFFPDSVDRCFMYYLSNCTKDDLYDLSKTVISSYHPHAPELAVVKQNLNEQVEALEQAIGDMISR
jgi:hypothetical protein